MTVNHTVRQAGRRQLASRHSTGKCRVTPAEALGRVNGQDCIDHNYGSALFKSVAMAHG